MLRFSRSYFMKFFSRVFVLLSMSLVIGIPAFANRSITSVYVACAILLLIVVLDLGKLGIDHVLGFRLGLTGTAGVALGAALAARSRCMQ